MTRARKEEIKKRIAARNITVIKGGKRSNVKGESEFQKKKHEDAIAFLKKNGLPKSLRPIKWDD